MLNRNKTWLLPILILTTLLLLPLVTADPEQYLTWGVTRDNTFNQDGNGVWTGRTATTYQRTENYTTKPLVADVDNDGTNEIIITRDANLYIYNYTTGVGLILEAAYDFHTSTYVNAPFYQTPALMDYDLDNFIEIVVFNVTHMLTLEWDGASIRVDRNATTTIIDVAGLAAASYPVIKCAPGSQWASGNTTCIMPARNRSVATQLCALAYDMMANTTSLGCAAGLLTNPDTFQSNTHLADGDSDGLLEMYYRYYDLANDDIDLTRTEVSASNEVTMTNFFSHNLVGNALFTDIVVNNLDGTLTNGMEITWGYTSDGVNWKGYSISDSILGGAVTTYTTDFGLCDIPVPLVCGGAPEGELASLNLVIADDTTYCPFSGDVYYHIRNSQNNDPGTDIDTILCLSLVAGITVQENTVANPENFTAPYFIHQTPMYDGTTGLLTSLFGIKGATKQALPVISTQQWIIPVDYQISGSVDLIGVNDQTQMIYYDDAYTNENIQINTIGFDTANPVCQNEILGLTIGLTDAENNPGQCHILETYANGTHKSLQSNTSFTPPTSITLNYFADEVGTYPLNLRCKDQYHDTYTSRTYTAVVGNDTATCNYKGDGAGTLTFTPDANASANQGFATSLNTALSDVGVNGTVMKGIVWLIVMMIVIGGVVFSALQSGATGQATGIIVMFFLTTFMLLGWYLDMIGAVPLIILALLLAAVIGFKVFSNSANVTGGG